MRFVQIGVLGVLFSLVGVVPAEGSELETLADELVRLRSDVESLNSRLEAQKRSLDARLDSLALRKADLEAAIQRDRTEAKELRRRIGKTERAIEQSREETDLLRPSVLRGLEALESSIAGSLPYARSRRLQAVEELRQSVEQDVLGPEKALSQLWSLYEDELRLRRETGLINQVVIVEGQELLAEVARFGMMLMYFKTEDGRYGKVVQADEGYRYVLATAPAETDLLETLFTAMKRGIQVGPFSLPNTLSPEVWDALREQP